MWEILSGLLELAAVLSAWRVWAAFFAGLGVGWAVGYAFADSSGFIAMFFAIVAMIPGYLWHRQARHDADR
jgi:hypothetical protein